VRRARRHDQAGTTLIELMVALTILLVAMAGFWTSVVQSVTSTGIAHRRTVGTWLRSDLVDRISLTRRAALTPTPANEWVIDQCFDNGGEPTTANPAFLTDFACAASDGYRRWVSVTPDTQRVNEYGFEGPIWRVSIYVESILNGCTPATRWRSLGCTAAEYYLTD